MTFLRPCLAACLLALLAGHAVPALSAAPELEAFDLRKCLRWSIAPAPQVERSAAWRAARARAKPPLQVFAATADLPEGGTLHKYGACSLLRERRGTRLRCVPVLDFPLAGASFVAGTRQEFRTVTTFACASGCDQKIPDAVYELRSVAAGDELQDKEEHARSTPFRRACAGLR